MIKTNNKPFPNPEGKIKVLKRYLHILALLNNPEANSSETWNSDSLARLLEEEEKNLLNGEAVDIDGSSVRKYISDIIEKELGIVVDRKYGRGITGINSLDKATQFKIASVYSMFVIKDTTRDSILKKFINSTDDKGLWLLARVYFAIIEKRRIRINYTNNTGYKINEWILCPYYFIFRNNNLYLVVWDPSQKKHIPLLADRIRDLHVLEKTDYHEWDIVAADDLFEYSLSAFITEDKPVNVSIRYSPAKKLNVETVVGVLGPEVRQMDDGWFTAEFPIIDYHYLCKQLFIYGSEVEILSPPLVRQAMIDMLNETMSVYKQ